MSNRQYGLSASDRGRERSGRDGEESCLSALGRVTGYAAFVRLQCRNERESCENL